MKAFFRLKEDLKKNRWQILLGLIALIIVDILQLFIPRVTKIAIDELTSGKVTSRGLLIYAFEILGIALIIGIFRYVWRYFLLGSARRVEQALRERLFNHLQSLSYNYFSKNKVGEIMAYVTNDIEAVRISLAMGIVFCVDTIVIGILTIFFMAYIQPLLTLYTIIPMPFITFTTLYFSKIIHKRFEILQKTFGSLMEKVRESISGIRVIKAYVQEDSEREKLGRIGKDYIQKSIYLNKAWGVFFPLLMFLSNIPLVIILFLGGKLTILQVISMGDFVAFISYLGMLSWPMMALGWAINLIQRGSASMERLNRIFEEKPEITIPEIPKRIEKLKGKIEIKGLTFKRDNGEPVLKDINLTVNEGERLTIVGRTGTGKSLLCDLITRILDPPEGCIFLDGIEIHQISLKTLRASIGYVPQDPFLFSCSLKENIAFGRIDAKEENIREAAEISQIYEEIMRFKEGMNTLVGEKGINLSGGQRQRVGIARAILMNPSIFILDDALSSVDIQTEEKILEKLEVFLQGKTTIMITHRIATLKKANRIVVLDDGRIVEEGDHHSLLSKNGVYARIYWEKKIEEELEKED